jgi:hypothetical protein
MPLDPTTVVTDPRWLELGKDPAKLQAAEDDLFKAFVASYPDYAAKLQAAPPAKQQEIRAGFSGMLRAKFPDRFPKTETDEARRTAALTGPTALDALGGAEERPEVAVAIPTGPTALEALGGMAERPSLNAEPPGDLPPGEGPRLAFGEPGSVTKRNAVPGAFSPGPPRAPEAQPALTHVSPPRHELVAPATGAAAAAQAAKQMELQNNPALDVQAREFADSLNAAQRWGKGAFLETLGGKAVRNVAHEATLFWNPRKYFSLVDPGRRSGEFTPFEIQDAASKAGLFQHPNAGVRLLGQTLPGLMAGDLQAMRAAGPLGMGVVDAAKQALDKQFDGTELDLKRMANATATGLVLHYAPMPKALQKDAGPVYQRMGQQLGRAVFAGLEMEGTKLAFGEQPNLESLGENVLIAAGLSAPKIVRSFKAGMIEQRLRKDAPNLKPEQAAAWANQYVAGNSPPRVDAIIENELTRKKFGEWLAQLEQAMKPAEARAAGPRQLQDPLAGAKPANSGAMSRTPETTDVALRMRPGPSAAVAPPAPPAGPVQPLEEPAAEVPTAGTRKPVSEMSNEELGIIVGRSYNSGMMATVVVFEDDDGGTAPRGDGTDVEYIKEVWQTRKSGLPQIVVGKRRATAKDLARQAERAEEDAIESTTALDPKTVPVVEMPLADIKLSKDVPNFKVDADSETGVVQGQKLEGRYERLGTPPIVLWRRKGGDLEVITGRHRLDLARRTGETTIPSQVVDEGQGFTKDMALTFDAEANIRDGQGSTEDYAHYFRNTPQLTEEAARSRGLLSRAKGKAGWDLGRNAGDDLYALWADGKITDAQAVAVARAAPGDAAAQRIGAKYAVAGKPAEFVGNVVRAAMQEAGGRGETLDLFGADDSALKQAEEMAKRATAAQQDLQNQIRAVHGAAKRPAEARKLGVNIDDPQGVLKRVEGLKADLARWQNWPVHPDLVAQVRGATTAEVREPGADYQANTYATVEKTARMVIPAGDTTANLLSRELTRKARALVDAVEAGRIDREEALQRFNETARAARREEDRLAPKAGGEQADLFGKQPGMLFEPGAQYGRTGDVLPARNISQTSTAALRKDPDFDRAKRHEDVDAAVRVIERLVKPDRLRALRDQLPAGRPIYVVPVIASENAPSLNALPIAYAKAVADAVGGKLWLDIVKTGGAPNTDAPADQRSRNVQAFTGTPPPADAVVILADDTFTTGATLKALAVAVGRRPDLVTTLASGRYGNALTPDAKAIKLLLGKAGVSREQFFQILGYEPEALTGAQIQQYLLNGAAGRAGLVRRFPSSTSAGGGGKAGEESAVQQGQGPVAADGVSDYLRSVGVNDDAKARQLKEDLDALQEAPGTPYIPGLEPATGSARPADPATGAGAGVRIPVTDAEAAAHAALRDPMNPAVWDRIFGISQTASSLIRSALSEAGIVVQYRGMKIRTSRDAAAAVYSLRSPLAETMAVVFLDKNNKVLSTEVVSVGILNASLVDFRKIIGPAPAGAVSVIMAHNHPSGNPSPSAEDLMISRRMVTAAGLAGFDVIDHIITQGGAYVSLRDSGLVEFAVNMRYRPGDKVAEPGATLEPALPEQAAWEGVKRGDLHAITMPQHAQAVLNAMRQGAPGNIHVLVLTHRNALTAALRLPGGSTPEEILRQTLLVAAQEGGSAVIFDLHGLKAGDDIAVARKLVAGMKAAEIQVLDAMGPSAPFSMSESGLVSFAEERAGYVVREGAPEGPGYLGPAGGPVPIEDDPNQHMPIELPEMVALFHDLTGGKYPKIRQKMGQALGRFRGAPARGGEEIELLASLFKLVPDEQQESIREAAHSWAKANFEEGGVMSLERMEEERFVAEMEKAYKAALKENPKLASRVMAHELMHFVDFLPDRTLERGNILGHIAAFKHYLLKSIGDHPQNPEQAIPKEERAKMRRLAEKQAGKRPPKDEEAELEMWRQEVAENYREMLDTYAEANGILLYEDVRAELDPLIAWWRGTDTIPDYYTTGTEMFAEAGSIFLNNPAAMAKRAPRYYNALLNWMENRPEVKREYEAIQDLIKSGKVMTDRVQRLRTMLRDSTEIAGGLEEQGRALTAREWIDRIRYGFSRTFGPYLWRAKRVRDPAARRSMEQAIGDYLYRKSWHELYLGRMKVEVMEPLLKANLDFLDLSEFMFHKHVANNRTDIANPHGWTPKISSERLAEMERELGPERWAGLEAARRVFWLVRQEEVIEPLRRSGIFDEKTMEILASREFYATIAPVRATEIPEESAKGHPTIEQLLTASFGQGVGGMIYRQYGFMGAIKDPWLATMQKDLALLNMAAREATKRACFDALQDSTFADEWTPADMVWNGRYREPKIIKTDRVGTLIYVQDGKVRAWYGPRVLVDAFSHGDAIENRLVIWLNKWLSQSITRLWTQLNYGFWPVARARDIGAFRDQMPGARAGVPVLRRFGVGAGRSFWEFRRQAQRASRSSILGTPDPTARRALGRGMMITRPEAEGVLPGETPIDQLLRSHGLPAAARPDGAAPSAAAPVVHALRALWERWKMWGQVNERSVKIAGMLYLDKYYPDMPEARKRELVREMSGSPDFLSRGALAPWINLIFPLYNPIIRGTHSTGKSWRDRPGERAWKTIKYTLLPLVALEAFRRGMFAWLLGDDDSKEISKLIDAIPRYDRDNYYCYPLGWVDRQNSKALYLRVPMHEAERAVHVFLSKLLRADQEPMDTAGLWNVAGGQAPGLNPLFKVGMAWTMYKTTGRAPVDPFSGQQLLGDDEALIGAGDTKLWKWTWNQMGGTIITRFDNVRPDDDPTLAEQILRQPVISNTLGRWVKVSNKGVYEKYRLPAKAVEKAEAQRREDARDMIERVMAGEGLTVADQVRIKTDPYFSNYAADKLKEIQAIRAAGPEARAIMDAGSKLQEAVTLQAIMEDR